MCTKKFYLKLLMSLLLMALTVPQGKAEPLIVAETTSTDLFVPLYGSWMDDAGTYSQTIYTPAQLSSMAGQRITSIAYHPSEPLSSNFNGCVLQVSLKEISQTGFSSTTPIDGMTANGTCTLSGGETVVLFNLDEPFEYSGDNSLVVDVHVKTGAGYATVNWCAMTTPGSEYCSIYHYNTTTQRSYKIPMTTFTYEQGTIESDASKLSGVTGNNYDFGALAVNGSDTLNLTLKNTGANAFTPSVTITGTGFSTTYTAAALTNGQTTTIPVVFKPTTAGDFNGNISINCGAAGSYSIDLTGTAVLEKTIADATDYNEYLPVYGYNHNEYNQQNQMLYPASMLTDLVGKKLKSITFYPATVTSQSGYYTTTTSGINFKNGSATVSLATATAGTITYSASGNSRQLESALTTVGTISIPSEAQTNLTEWTISFSENGYIYSGGDLLVDISTVKGSYGRTYFYGQTTGDYAGYSCTSSTAKTGQKFLPKVTFAYEDGETPATPVITVDPATVEAFTTEVGTPVTATVNVTGENLTGDITATVSGDDAFTAALENGVLTITYNPTAAGNHTATVTLSSTGAQDVTIALTGTATAAAVPTIAVNPAAVTITTAPTTTGTATFTVTGTNLTGDITVAASDSWFTVSPTTIAAADAANGVTVTVSYQAPGTEETKKGTITITSNGATEKIVNLTAKSEEVIAEGAVTPTALNFGEVLVDQTSAAQLVKVSNTGSEAFTPSFSIDNSAFSIDEPTEIAGGTSISYNVTFTPTAAGTQTGTLTVTFGGNTFTVTLMGKGTELAGYDITSSEASGVHNFGDVFKDGIATWNVTLTNNGANAVTPVIEGLAAPFSAENVPETLAAGQNATITFKFAPTAIQAYGPTSVVVKFAETTEFQFDYTFRGNGIENTGTLPPSTYDGYSYTWTDDNGDEHTSTYSEIATDPNQMIALMKAVYTNKNLPGNYYRGYKADGTVDTDHPVAYPAIGQITVDKNNNTEFLDAYGWGMTHDEANYPINSKVVKTSANEYSFYTMNPNEYKPNEEGLTLLLVEMNDGVGANTTTTKPTDYASLKNLYGTMFKSVRVIPNSKKVTKDGVEGTLFKIDCDKMNRFFFLAKGRLRLYDETDYSGGLNMSSHARATKKLSGSSSGQVSVTSLDNENTTATVNPFNAMYEQFSPVSLSSGQASSDVYQELINMQSYPVEHDCESIPWASVGSVSGHEFNMYGKSSISEDCQDVRDLMFFVPDKRMMYYSGRDKGANDMFVNYYKQTNDSTLLPTMGMYVIRQNEITGAQNGTANEYILNLSWESNLTDFVPGESGVYTIYQVNDDGTYTQVATNIPSNQTTYQVTVPMVEHGQQVTYVIQGQDNTGFLSLQFSNEESFIIPGTDADEVFQLVPNADIYSRFDPAQETNFYANGMQIKTYPGVATDVYAGKTLNYYRKAAGETEWTKVATAAVNNDATQATVATVEGTQRQQSEYIYGYKANASTMTIAADGHGYNVFGVIYDNFKASVEGNNHPNYYNYKVEIDGENAHSNEITVRVFKTAMSTIDGEFDKTTVDEDLTHTVGLEKTAFDIDVQHSSKTEVLRYGAYRWTQSENPAILSGTADAEEDISPNGQASNQGEYYTVYMNGDSFIGEDVYVAQGETAQASFEDNVPDNNPDAYVYAPVVETFTGRADYNTYGAPMQTTATGKTELTVGELSASTYKFTPEGKTGDYVYYNIPLTANVTIPENYDIYKMRAWRLIDEEWLGEIDPAYAERVNPDYLYETLDDASKGQPIPVGIDVITRPGTNDQNVLTGTFGAKKLAEGESFTAKFIVRTYFTRTAETSTFNAAQSVDGKYYITETVIDVPVTNQVVTGVINVNAQKAVAGVMYYNLAGVESEEPFSGVNIVVTRYTDGSISTAKVLK